MQITSWVVALDLSITNRWVKAKVFGTLVDVWLQARTLDGNYWVQISPDGPFRLVDQIF
jgi:hypothetical protein